MKAAPTLGALAIFATCWTLCTAGQAEENATLERFNRAHETLDGLGPEVIVERAIFRAELDHGIAIKAWTKQDKETALERMRSAFELPDDEKIDGPGFVPPWFSMSGARETLRSGPPSLPTAPLLDWLGWRVGALREVREQARRTLRAAALDCAETAWLSARDPADLEPAIRQVNEARISFDKMWGIVNQARGPGSVSPPYDPRRNPEMVSTREAVDVYDFLSVLMSGDPFFLPDPVENPAGFAAGRAIWPDLVQMGHAFTLRPAIAARFHRYNTTFSNLQTATGRRLNELIEHNASAAEFEPHYNQWRALANLEKQPRRPPLRGTTRDTPAADDYRDLAARSRASHAAFTIFSPPPASAAYAAWFDLRKAEEAAEPDRIEKAQAAMNKERASLPLSTATYLTARIHPVPEVPADLAPKDDNPVDALIARLRSGMEQNANRPRGDARALGAVWEALRNGTAAPSNEVRELPNDHWTAFSILPGSSTVFALRDRAARQLLARFYPADAALVTSVTPLATEFRERLTTALTTGSVSLTGKLLALDAAGNFLPPTEHLAWAHDAAMLRNAATLLAADQRAAARTAYLQAIQQLSEPSLGEFAARQALRLRSTPSAKVP